MQRVSVIDIGTNSVIILVLEIMGGEFNILFEQSLEPRLGEGLERSGLLSKAAMQRTIDACNNLIERSGLDIRPQGTGTHALRIARNSDVFLELWDKAIGTPFNILSQEDEATLAYKGAGIGLDISGYTLIDVGGGSTEIISEDTYLGLPFGAVNLTERFGLINPMPDSLREEAIGYIRQHIDKPLQGLVLGAGGTASTLACLGCKSFESELVHGRRIDSIAEIAAEMRSIETDSIREQIPFAPKRADIINAGILIYETLLAPSADFIISQRGLRWGKAMDLLSTP